MLCNHHHCTFLESFVIPNRNFVPIEQLLLIPPSPYPLFCFLSLWICLFSVPPVRGIGRYLSSCDCLISLNIVFSRFIHVIICIRIPFFGRLNNILLYVCITFSSSRHLLADIWVVSALWLLWIMLPEHGCTGIGLAPLSIPLGIYIYIYQVVILWWTLWRATVMVSTLVVPFYNPTSNTQVSNLYTSSSIPVLFFFLFDNSYPNSVRCCVIVVLIFISLMPSDEEHLFPCFLAICIYPWRKVYWSPWPIFELGFGCCWVVGVLNIFWVLISSDTWFVFYGLSCHSLDSILYVQKF